METAIPSSGGRYEKIGEKLLKRVEQAVDRTIQMALALPRSIAGQEIGRQVIRSSGGAGANLEEAQATISRRDFTFKVSLVLRESRETLYWIRRIEANELLPWKRLDPLKTEWDEIVSIMTRIQKTLRAGRKP